MLVTMLIALAVCFAVTWILGKIGIPMLQKLKYGQQVRDDGPKAHLKKAGTPTMGGVIILIALVVVIFFDIKNTVLLAGVLFTIGFGLIGFLDDYIKIVKQRSLGLRAVQKIVLQLVLAALMAYYAQKTVGSSIWVPFLNRYFEMGAAFIPFMIFVIVGAVNGVNLTDGLDGLATGVMLVICAAYAMILYQLSKIGILNIGNIHGLQIFVAGFGGCLLGFLVYNIYPAKVFMGDTGSLALGGALSFIALCSNTVLLLPIMGGCFVASVVSVAMQVGSFKLTGKRIFKMAPLHHHFELSGMHETRVVLTYIAVTILLCLIALFAFV